MRALTIVDVNGSTFKGEGLVLWWVDMPAIASPTEGPLGMDEGLEKPFPQCCVRCTDGKDRTYDGGDLEEGKLTAKRPATRKDLIKYAKGQNGWVLSPEKRMGHK